MHDTSKSINQSESVAYQINGFRRSWKANAWVVRTWRATAKLSYSAIIALACIWIPNDDAMSQEAAAYAKPALEEIIVTARRREESLMETPVAITAFTTEDLESRHIRQSNQIAEATPNMMFYNQTAGGGNHAASVFIRGIGQADWAPSVQQGVGTYVDGAFVGTLVGGLVDNLDVESIQVLRGPQGTLFGRNSIGGAILITSVKPSNELNGYVDLSVGEFDLRQLKASVNVPLSDTFYAKASVLLRDKDGYLDTPNIPGDDGFGSDKTRAGRLALRWLPTESVKFDLTANFTDYETDGNPRGAFALAENTGNIGVYNNVVAPALGLPLYLEDEVVVPPEEYITLASFIRPQGGEIWNVNLDAEFSFGSVTLNSLTSYREQESQDSADQDSSPLNVEHNYAIFDADQFAQEFRFSGLAVDDRLHWLLGLYYFTSDTVNFNPIRFPQFALLSGTIIANEASAIFGQTTYNLTSEFSITLGGRYTDEKLISTVDDRIQYVSMVFNPNCTGPCAQPSGDGYFPASDGLLALPIPPDPGAFRIIQPQEFRTDYSGFDPYINLKYQWTDELMGYLSYSEGFKGGGFTQRITPGRLVQGFTPEFAKVYELGAKFSLERLRLSGALFHTDYTDLQVPVSQVLGTGIENAGDAEIKGFELEALWAATDNLQFSFGFGHLDSKYTQINENVQFSIDNRLPSAPDWTANASAVYTIPMTSLAGRLVSRIDYAYVSDYFVGARNEEGTLVPSWHVMNLAFTFIPDSEKWEFAIEGRNVTDEVYATNINGNLVGNGRLDYYPAPPAEWVARFKFRF